MNKEDIIRMAREAGFPFNKYGLLTADDEGEIDADAMLERFAALVAAAEREACERMAKAFHHHGYDFTGNLELHEAIRARRTSTISPATLIDPRGSLGEPIV